MKSLLPISFLVCLLVVTLQLGCKKDSPTGGAAGGGPTINSFTATPNSLPGGGGSVTFEWRVAGATSLSISPGVGSVTPPDSGSTVTNVTSTTTFTLTATNSAGNANANATVTVASALTVNGFVKDRNGDPISGAAVILTGRPAVTTGSDGSFSVTNVSSPYDAVLVMSSQQTALQYKGLTRSDPVLLFLGTTGTPKTATITGTVPISTQRTRVYFVSGDKAWYTTASTTNGSYTINAFWFGATTTYNGQLYVLRWTPATGLPTDYTAYGNRTFTISAGGTFNTGTTFSAGDIGNNPPEANIGVTAVRPSGYSPISFRSLSVMYGNADVFIASESGTLGDNYNYTVPTISGATFGIYAETFQNTSTTSRFIHTFEAGITGGSNMTLNLESSPTPALPANNGTNIDTVTDFSWGPGGGTGVSVFELWPTTGVGSSSTYYVFTVGTTSRIPNLAPQGLGLPSNRTYFWQLEKFIPFSSINDIASDAFISNLQFESGSQKYGRSERWVFTTTP